MKIISYNINLSNSEKVKTLLNENADVYVVPEIAEEAKQDLPSRFTMEWIGVHYNKPFLGIKSKGLGIIWRVEKGIIADEYNDKLLYAIPLIYDDILILGIWPTKFNNQKTYTQLAKEIIEKYKPHFSDYKQCIITGDFNLYHKENSPNKAADIFEIDSILTDETFGFHSVYHKRANEQVGFETRNTFYMTFKRDKPFFLDYTYAKLSVKNYYFIENSEEKFSDHIGQVIEI